MGNLLVVDSSSLRLQYKKLQKYYGLAICQNTLPKLGPSEREREVDAAVYAMRKYIVAILRHTVRSNDLAKQYKFCPSGEGTGVKGSRIMQLLGTKTDN